MSVGTRVGGKVHVFSLFKEEVIVPMFDLHFRKIQVQGFWLSQASATCIGHTTSKQKSMHCTTSVTVPKFSGETYSTGCSSSCMAVAFKMLISLHDKCRAAVTDDRSVISFFVCAVAGGPTQ